MTASFEIYLRFLSGLYLSTYSIVIIICILFYLFANTIKKQETVNWLYTFNSIVLFISCLQLILYIWELFIVWYGQNPYEWYAFREYRINLFSPYGRSYWVMMLFNFLLPQLFWFKKLRKNVLFTFIVAFTMSSGLWFERLVIFITSMHRDYLPSSWSTYYTLPLKFLPGLLLQILCFALFSFCIYWLLHKRKKLPFPSALLSYFLFFTCLPVGRLLIPYCFV